MHFFDDLNHKMLRKTFETKIHNYVQLLHAVDKSVRKKGPSLATLISKVTDENTTHKYVIGAAIIAIKASQELQELIAEDHGVKYYLQGLEI